MNVSYVTQLVRGDIRFEANHTLWIMVSSLRKIVSRTEHEMLIGLRMVSPQLEDSAMRSQLLSYEARWSN